MDLERHDFQLDDLVERIKDNDHRLVALQVPEGLKMQALEMMDAIEENSAAKVVLAADPCYGACDLVHDKMRMMGVELVAHMGHSAMNIDSGMPTHFIPVTYDGDPEIDPVVPILARHKAIAEARMSKKEEELTDEEAQERFLDAVGRVAPLSGTRLGLVGSIQHLHLLQEYKERLEKAGFDVEIPIGGARLTFPGQVLGCNYSGDDPTIGHYLFLGSGDFHPIGLVMHTGKPLALLDPYTGEAGEMSLERIERILRQRMGLIFAVDNANSFGILIGEKPGQMRRNLAIRMKRLLETHGKKGYLLALDHVGPDLIDFYPVDAFVNTACPRIAIDDAVKYDKPLITPFELEVALGEKQWENGYQFDEIP
ncbi:MAG: diphthamide biosynthesis enzyme Dph2 [Candidatus Thalassarchaeaceae archaeon]|jgi:2-(3-amino-3-carboxypropyl)histidine synthase|nr:diphthamide biosynthesis enzyme Dph2 [Candidatus Thalassarchaeaceae archaeon]DAC33285.1 MAG TPA: diphthamide biosynthesis enzyme Dph2 [Candidatus Poseidoniales archaeon]MDP6317773.1 diphthamide biosynthesis enzyme Dph2 [Candidatus Thalassarchaeaceae archaeon]HIH80664.1 diphthamide biosynthesis enzyme Dph2 [Candidatus Thalassarchaeaceae archaeon]HJM29792.1 diphthamide biosynthesis enzyme Dph2 [Candidatus Thalassarchaeaceae archaeon]